MRSAIYRECVFQSIHELIVTNQEVLWWCCLCGDFGIYLLLLHISFTY